MKKLSAEVAQEINEMMIRDYSPGEMVGVREPNLLDSSIERPFQTMYGDSLYSDIFEKATALFESLAKNHVFQNANKRTAFGCMTYFLFINGHVCVMNEEEAADLTVDFVTKKRSFDEVVQFIKDRSYRKSNKS
ncbi:type II toxin-antitoxin system death-on-curing family toxin [Jeotgalibacillus sp. ET6]|uniref:type II toxin-antitoxin system death-on-curing family toxin n=1 Tax=Jeotgalibacillus sp. ET6 TaxID=3037260 RepID=UPI002418176F|nr:type II toxin-antitoxin system death-on-curing family toxin [Jeotgalibacillus sp. ET6]MDG5471224.1 type II toxin-antitoxin system death-on-curing family toxin [Jeotgalibacillus sp. ET6]